MGVLMCLICVEYYFKRMTKDEVKNALPEMIMFAKTEEERIHFKKLLSMNSDQEIEQEVENYVVNNSDSKIGIHKNDIKTSSKTRRS
jgi:hypothetical protein